MSRLTTFSQSWRTTICQAVVSFLLLAASTNATSPSIAPRLNFTWERFTDLPDPIGLKGMYAGVSRGAVLLAGGSNFPVPQREGGAKTFHRTILVQRLPLERGRPWTTAPTRLPHGLGEGVSFTTDHGIVCLGGHDGTGPVDAAFVLSFGPATGAVEQRPLPNLPQRLTNAAGTFWRGKIYLAGGDAGSGGVAGFWSLDLAAARQKPDRVAWKSLPVWPGPKRFGAVLAVVAGPEGEHLLLAGGAISLSPPRAQTDYLADAYLYDGQQWTRAADLPRPALLPSAAKSDGSTLVLFSGSDGHDLENMKALGERYRVPDDILIYHAREDRWERDGTMPLGAVAPALVELGNEWLLAGGEYSPGLRTPHVYLVRPASPDASSR